jgi:KTSC domain
MDAKNATLVLAKRFNPSRQTSADSWLASQEPARQYPRMYSSRLLLTLLAIMLSPQAGIAVEKLEGPIPRTAVVSSNLKSVGYDSDSKTLEIEFKNGSVYRYFEVPPATNSALMKSDSKGKFFHSTIRGKFRFERRDTKR